MTVRPISTYPALLAEIADWADRASLNDATNSDVIISRPNLGPVAPTFVALAETEMRRVLDTRNMTVTTSVTLDDDGGFDLPCDFGGLVSLVTDPTSDGRYFPQLIGLGNNSLAEQARVYTYGYAGLPRYYTVTKDRIIFAPQQSDLSDGSPLVMQFTYRQALPQLTLMSPSNWMLASNPDCYLYGSLKQAALYLKDFDQVGPMDAAFQAALDSVNMEGIRQRRSAVLRMKVSMVV